MADPSKLLKAFKAWHGSPYDFDRFSLKNLGRGEGSNIRGPGLYFTTKEDNARRYRDQALEFAEERGDPLGPLDTGWVYEALINADPKAFATIFAPESRQSKSVRDLIYSNAKDPEWWMRRLESGKNFSEPRQLEELMELGLPGVRDYHPKDRSWNYVVGDPDLAQIKNRYAAGGQVEEPGVTLLGSPPTLRDPFKEQFQARGPVGGADVSSLLAMANRGQRGQPDPAALDALLAKLAAAQPPPNPQAAAPPAAPPDPASPYDDYLAKLRVPDPDAVNKDTGATGHYDFIPSTFRGTIDQHFPDLAKLSDEELAPLMRDPRVARQVAIAFTQGNERHLASKGLPASDYTRYLAHWFGPAGAVDLLTGDDTRKMEDWFEGYYPKKGAHWAKANALEGKTAAEVLAIAKKRMAGRG